MLDMIKLSVNFQFGFSDACFTIAWFPDVSPCLGEAMLIRAYDTIVVLYIQFVTATPPVAILNWLLVWNVKWVLYTY